MDTTIAPTQETKSNPSRKTCEEIVHRILITEVLKNGSNTHFKKATDFMDYFESLYPASDALTKQVQRAIKSMNMPRDEKGYFIPDKTPEQMEEDRQIARLIGPNGTAKVLEDVKLLFLPVESRHVGYLVSLINDSVTFKGKFITLIETGNGILFVTDNAAPLQMLIENLTVS